MRSEQHPSVLEKITGNVPAQTGITLIAALAGSPIAALLPVLVGSLASRRHAERIERNLCEIAEQLQIYSERLDEISDTQYKILDELFVSALHTTEKEKIALLKNCVHNTLASDKRSPQEAVLVSRIIRDISVEEAQFLHEHREIERVHIRTLDAEPNSDDPSYLRISPDSEESLIVEGLLSLGILTPGEPTLEQSLTFSKIAPVIVSLLKAP